MFLLYYHVLITYRTEVYDLGLFMKSYAIYRQLYLFEEYDLFQQTFKVQ